MTAFSHIAENVTRAADYGLVRLFTGRAAPKNVLDRLEAERLGTALPGRDADPILLISGLTADHYWYRRGKEMLEAQGFHVEGMAMPWHGWDGIPSDAKHVKAAIEATLASARAAGRDVSRVTLLGDSEGGLIARQALQFEDGVEPLVGRLVTNGTPHGAIRLFANDAASWAVAKFPLMPPGVRDLMSASRVMQRLDDDWPLFLRRMREERPDFQAHSIASRLTIAGRKIDHDTLVPVHSAHLPGPRGQVFNYVTDGPHSIHLAFGHGGSESAQILMAALGSTDPKHHAVAAPARGLAQAIIGTRGIPAIWGGPLWTHTGIDVQL